MFWAENVFRIGLGYATWLSPNQNIDKTTLMTLFFEKVCFVIDTTEHIIWKNGEHGISW
jgi:hypothetical protein